MKTFVAIFAMVLTTSSAQYLLSSPWTGLVHPWAAQPLLASSYLAPRLVAPQVLAPAITVPTSSQYHAQDELGQFAFGHRGDNQARDEVKSFDGSVRGGYSYVDPNGKLINVQYLADHNGFRVLGANNLPEAPAVPAPIELVGPSPVQDTAEVIAARADFTKKFAEAAEAAEKSPEEPAEENKEKEAEKEPEKEPEKEEAKSRKRRQILWSPSILSSSILTRSLVAPTPILTHAAYAPIASYAPIAPIVPLAKTTIKTSELKPIEDAKTPAGTKKADIEEKEQEVISPLGSLILPQTRTIVLSKDEKKQIFSPLPLTPYSTIFL